MAEPIQAPINVPHYPTAAARSADLAIHVIGLVFALLGGSFLVVLSAAREPHRLASIIIYACGLVLMLAFSLAYNFASERRQPTLRRLDHAGIFLMIAGSYTPFTTCVLTGSWAWGMTATIWTMAAIGILGKLFLPNLRENLWLAFYLTMGWLIVLAYRPIMAALPQPVLALLLLGGIVYSIGVIFYVHDRLQFSRSIWHGHVVTAAGVHWVAILLGTVLPMVR